ncbi:MAG: hypothetical protein AB7F19_01230 [Candidatus Babeliales bacterium]
MNIDFYKVFEDATTVNYLIETKSYEKITTGVTKKLVKALCIFDKIEQKIKFDPEKTDTFFFERINEPLMIEAHLKRFSKKQQGFPDTYNLCTGG